MKKYFKIIFTIILLLIAILLLTYFYKSKIVAPSFAINIKGDYTSSGASRAYNATIEYKDNEVIGGTQSFDLGQGGGCVSDCNKTTVCKIKDKKWIDSVTGNDCTLNGDEYLSKESLKSLIRDNKLIPMKKCMHLDTCFEIKNRSMF